MARKRASDMIGWRPLTGLLDNRSNPDDMPPFSFRLRKNLWQPEERKLCRMPGWTKLFSASPYNNQDLHDQMLAAQQYYASVPGADDSGVDAWPDTTGMCSGSVLTLNVGRQPFTMLYSATSTAGTRRLFAATESRLYSLNEKTGGWRLLADGYGEMVVDGTSPRLRFYATQNGDRLLFTNDFDEPMVHVFDQPHFGCDIEAVSSIPDLAVIGLSKAAVTFTWRGITFLADVEMDGLRYEQRLVWSNFEDLTSWDPAKTDSLAGFQDLEFGEKILGGEEAGDVFLIYTSRRIWEMRAVGGEILFEFHKRYTPSQPGLGCLAFRNTLVAYRGTHYYCGYDGIYAYNLNLLEPERVQWIHAGSGVMFNNLAADFCNHTVAGFNTKSNELWISWVPAGSVTGLPTQTLVVNLRYPMVHTVDDGFTAFVNHQPDTRGSVRDFILQYCACDIAGLDALGYGYTKEGLPTSEAACPILATSIYTDVGVAVLDATVEDWEQPTHAANSLCTFLDGVRLDTLCQACEDDPDFIMASSVDWAIKQFAPEAFYREMVDPADYNNAGTMGDTGYTNAAVDYILNGYDSYLRTGAQGFGEKRDEKTIRRLVVIGSAAVQTEPSDLELRVGYSSQAYDSNDEAACSILWQAQNPQPLDCLDNRTTGEHAAARTRPAKPWEWPLFNRGYFLYWELKIAGTGGSSCFSEVLQDIMRHDAFERY